MTAEDVEDWAYRQLEDTSHKNGHNQWGSLNLEWKTCNSGSQQSPIDIVKDDAKHDPSLETLKRDHTSAKAFLVNNEFGIEPLQRVREELKSYVYKYSLFTKLEEPVKDLLQSYNILEELQQLKLSENSSGLQKEGDSASKQRGETETEVFDFECSYRPFERLG